MQCHFLIMKLFIYYISITDYRIMKCVAAEAAVVGLSNSIMFMLNFRDNRSNH
jgi:hypothetical protein